ncbi:MAG: decarboxylating 6-phosphogluconate dehydrogenase [Planctomycetes bacterium]|nr:decarboxylating 6-phosphogluconate dehydrogenase [Planctomycetota bacterium]
MELGFVGLGKMGMNMVTRLMQGGHRIVVYNREAEAIDEAARRGAVASRSLKDLVSKLSAPRVVWLMIPSGDPVEKSIQELSQLLTKGDLVVDGGNSNFHDSQRRAVLLKERGIGFCDAGTSGGIWGLKNGYCLMVGGEPGDYKLIEPALATLAPKDGCLHAGPPGAGHFAKMVHNGIEYGLMQAYAEGFEILKTSPYQYDLQKLTHLWNQGSVVRSWLLELAERMFEDDPKLESLKGFVPDSGEGRWTIQAAIDQDVPAPIITLSLLARLSSRQPESFSAKVLAGLRNQFGGHAVQKKN